jgi:hypothetical protein
MQNSKFKEEFFKRLIQFSVRIVKFTDRLRKERIL